MAFARNRYSVPSSLVGRPLIVRGTDDTVSNFLGPKQVARHVRSWIVGENVQSPTRAP